MGSRIMMLTAIFLSVFVTSAWGSLGKDTLAKCLYEEVVASSQDTLWSKANCNEAGNGAVKGFPVDAVCASVADVCRRKSSSAACKSSGCTWSSGKCKWSGEDGCLARSTKAECGTDRCKWANGACTWNRDAKNNVCLHPPAGHSSLPDATLNCANILKGKCPRSWEVPNGCCLSEHSKYEMLLESTPGFVCCNAPCTSLEASYKAGTQVHLFALPSVTTATGLVVSNQTVCNGNMGSTLCAPGMRRYFSNSNGMGRQGGMMDMNMQLATMGMFGGGPLSGGRVIGGYGAVDVPEMGYMNVMDLDNMSDEGHVEEISMDDFMDTLIEALDTDADVFESDRQITSDPWFGKQKFSLGPNGIKFADPMDIFNDIYGNPGFGVPGGMGPYGPFGGRGPFGPIGKMKPYGKSYGGYGKGGFGGYGVGGYGGYGVGGYGGYGMGGYGGYGKGGFWTPYSFSNYGPGPHGQPQDYGQQPPVGGQQPLPTNSTQDGQEQQQEQPVGYQPPHHWHQPVYPQQPAYQLPGYPRPPAYGQQSSHP